MSTEPNFVGESFIRRIKDRLRKRGYRLGVIRNHKEPIRRALNGLRTDTPFLQNRRHLRNP